MSDARYPIYKRAGGGWKLAQQCACPNAITKGLWLFEHDGALYCFDPPTQKDIWLGEKTSPGPRGRDARLKALRWECFGCRTVQMP